MADETTPRTMRKELGLATATSIVVGCVIGAGVFFKPYAIYQATGGAPGMGMLAWVVGGLMSIFGALTFAEVAILIPRTGGMVAYLSEVFDERLGFLAGWMQVVIFYPAFLAGYGVKVGSELATYLGEGAALHIALVVIAALVLINCLGSRAAGGMQVVATACKLIPLALIIVFGFAFGTNHSPILAPLVGEGKGPVGVLGSTLLAVLFAFEGWTNVGTIAGEMRDPGRDMPRAIVGGVSIIMAVYLAINSHPRQRADAPRVARCRGGHQALWRRRRHHHPRGHHHLGHRRRQWLFDVRLARGISAGGRGDAPRQSAALGPERLPRARQLHHPHRHPRLPLLPLGRV